MQLSFAAVVKQVAPAVVNIYSKRRTVRAVGHPFMNDPFFQRFFGGHGFGGLGREQVESTLGSGLIVDHEGLVVTNAHVIRGAEEITVVLADDREYPAELLLSDEASDLALLKMDAAGHSLPVATLRPSESLEVGDLVLAIGNPFGVGQTVTSGIVSAQGRSSLNINDFNFFIQTDAAINPGNSGGPLVALDGGVVGINTAIFTRDGGSQGIGFAIPAEMVASVVAAAKSEGGIAANGTIVRPWLGVQAQAVTADIADSLGLEKPAGVLIAGLHEASPLLKAGAKVGDVVISVDGREVKDPAEMRFRLATVALGQETKMTLLSGDAQKEVRVAAIAPPDLPARQETAVSAGTALSGASVVRLNPAVAVELGLADYVSAAEAAVVVSAVENGTPATRLFAPGDILLEINERKIETPADVNAALAGSTGQRGISVTLKRGGRTQRIIVR